jgi:hypothetical protein
VPREGRKRRRGHEDEREGRREEKKREKPRQAVADKTQHERGRTREWTRQHRGRRPNKAGPEETGEDQSATKRRRPNGLEVTVEYRNLRGILSSIPTIDKATERGHRPDFYIFVETWMEYAVQTEAERVHPGGVRQSTTKEAQG